MPRMIYSSPVVRGTRSEVRTTLADAVEGWRHLGSDVLAGAAATALEAVDSGAYSVRVGHVQYVVTDDT